MILKSWRRKIKKVGRRKLPLGKNGDKVGSLSKERKKVIVKTRRKTRKDSVSAVPTTYP